MNSMPGTIVGVCRRSDGTHFIVEGACGDTIAVDGVEYLPRWYFFNSFIVGAEHAGVRYFSPRTEDDA